MGSQPVHWNVFLMPSSISVALKEIQVSPEITWSYTYVYICSGLLYCLEQ